MINKTLIIFFLLGVVSKDAYLDDTLVAGSAPSTGGRSNAMAQEQHEPVGPVTNSALGEAENVVQAGNIAGGVFFNTQSNREIEVVLEPEDDVVPLRTDGKPNPVPVTITNNLPGPQTIRLRIEGVSTNRWTVEPAEVRVSAGKSARAQLHLICTPTGPSAGPKQVAVRATNSEEKSWSSNFITVRVPAVHSIKVGEAVDPGRVTRGECTINVSVRNDGNTYLAGKMECCQPPENALSYLNPRGIKISDPSIRLAAGRTGRIAANVSLPPPSAIATKRHLLLVARLDGTDYQPSESKVSITQAGWISQIPHYLRQLRSWCSTKLGPYRRGSLIFSGTALFVAGMVLASMIRPSTAPDAATTAGPSRPAATSTSPIPSPLVQYVPMLCAPGMSIVFLASLQAQDADRYGAFLVRSETERLKRLDHRLRYSYVIHLSRRIGACEEALRDMTDPKYQAFLWTGPVPTGDESTVCADLGKTQQEDCHVDSMS